MIQTVKRRENIDSHLYSVRDDLIARLPSLLDKWKTDPNLVEHYDVLEKATTHYIAEDNISTSYIIYPQIEGLMRRFFNFAEKATQKALSNSVVSYHISSHDSSLLMPLQFREYLEKIFFAPFDPIAPEGASRNTITHGVIPPSELNTKTSTIGILILEQVIEFIQNEQALKTVRMTAQE